MSLLFNFPSIHFHPSVLFSHYLWQITTYQMLHQLHVDMDILVYNHLHAPPVFLVEYDLNNYRTNLINIDWKTNNSRGNVTLIVQDLLDREWLVLDDRRLVERIHTIVVDFDQLLLKGEYLLQFWSRKTTDSKRRKRTLSIEPYWVK